MLPVSRRLRARTPQGRSQAHERSCAKRLGGRLVPGSGNGRHKGDVRIPGIARIECKHTTARSFRVTAEMIEKIELAAACAGEIPVIEVHLEGVGIVHVMPAWANEMLLSKQREREGR